MHATKRQLIVASAVGVLGLGALTTFSNAAEAQIEFGGFAIDDYETTTGEAEVAILPVDPEVSYAATHGIDEIHV